MVSTIARTLFMSLLMMIAAAPPLDAARVDGTIKLGSVILDEESADLSTVQETYNLYEGFSVTQIRLNGTLSPQTLFALQLGNINRDNRQGSLTFRIPSRLRVHSNYGESRQIFDASRAVTSQRRDWRVGADFRPVEWLRISSAYGSVDREGDRLGFPTGTVSELGSRYDYLLQTGRVEVHVADATRGVAIAYDFSDFADNITDVTDRQGKIISARVHTRDFFSDKLTHVARVAYGKSELTSTALEYTLQRAQYSAVYAPTRQVRLRYNFLGSRIDDDATGLRTENFRHDIGARFYQRYATLWGGYGYEINDDDRSLTQFNVFNVGGLARTPERFTAKIDFTSRLKEDEENLTLLKETETIGFVGKIDFKMSEDFSLGGKYKRRMRKMPDIDVDIDGQNVTLFGRYYYEYFGDLGIIGTNLTVDYTFGDDEYLNRTGSFNTQSRFVTTRLDIDYEDKVRLGGGVTYTDIEEDLDIEKSIIFMEGMFTFRDDYHLEVKYNIYNYDDFVLLERYYTANVVWINVAYDFDVQR